MSRTRPCSMGVDQGRTSCGHRPAARGRAGKIVPLALIGIGPNWGSHQGFTYFGASSTACPITDKARDSPELTPEKLSNSTTSTRKSYKWNGAERTVPQPDRVLAASPTPRSRDAKNTKGPLVILPGGPRWSRNSPSIFTSGQAAWERGDGLEAYVY